MRKQIFNLFKIILFTVSLSAMLLFAVSAADNVVYLKDGGTGDGSSPDNAVNTLTKAHNALDLSADDATIVICGPYTQSVGWLYSGGEYEGTVTYTSVFGGVDYRETADASYQAEAVRFACLGETKFENIDFVCLGDYFLVVGQHNAVTLGEGVTITGDALTGASISKSFTILGGYQDGLGSAAAESNADTNITVLSGSNLYIIPFSREIEGAKYTGTANVTIGGTASVGVLSGSCAYPDGVTVGDVNITIKDNAAVSKFYGCVQDTTAASYTFTWSGGTIGDFYWVCPTTSTKTLTVTGKKTLVVNGDVDFAGVMNEFDVVKGAQVAFVKKGGNGDGSNPLNAADTLAEAFAKLDLTKDTTVVICGEFRQLSDFAYGKNYAGKVTFTSVFGGVDYRESAGAVWQFNSRRFACYGETEFENINFVSAGGYYRIAAQHNPVTIGEGVTVTGDALSGKTMANSFVVMGGYDLNCGLKKTADSSNTNVTVLSGEYLYVIPYSYNVAGTYTGTANVTIGGTAKVGVLHGSCAYPDGVSVGDVKLTVKDNAAVTKFYGVTQDTTAASYTLTWTGGTIGNFYWVCPATSSKTLTVTGKKTLIVDGDVDYLPIVSNFDAVDSPVAFVKDGGTGDGSDPDRAASTLADAFAKLDLSKDVTVVICGPFTQSETFAHGTDYSGKVTFTSVFGGVDYRESADAVWQFDSTGFACYGETKFENINFVSLGGYFRLVGQHNPVTLGEGVTVSGDELTGSTIAKSFNILGGYDYNFGWAKTSSSADTNVTVLSGQYLYIIPYSHNVSGTYTGTANITVGGTADVGVLSGSCVYRDGVTVGDVNVTIKDSAAVSKFYGCVQNTTAASYTFTWSGGTIGDFYWVSPTTSSKTLTVTGSKTLVVDGNVDYLSIESNFDTVDAQVVFVKDGGTGNGSSPENAVATLADAFAVLDLSKNTYVVICGAFTQDADFAYGTNYDGSVTFTSVFGGVDYRESAGAVWQFKASRFACYGDTEFENISFASLVTADDEATGDYYRIVGQHHNVTLGEGVAVTGDKLSGTLMANSFVVLGGFDKGFGYPKAATVADVNVTVLSGKYLYVIPYSHNISGTYTGTANITIGGTADVSVLLGSAAYPDGVTVGDVRIKLTDRCTVRKFYGCVQNTTMNSLEFEWESGTVYANFNRSNSDSNVLSVTDPTVLRVSNKAAASMYYAGVAAFFDTVISASSTPADIAPAYPTEEECTALDARGIAYSAVTFDAIGENRTEASIKIPVEGATDGIVYRVNGDFLTEIDADAVGNGHMAFDLEKDGTYVCSNEPLVIYGDVNSDKTINIADSLCLIKVVLGDRGEGLDVAASDMDLNEKITLIDVIRHLKMVVASGAAEEETFNPDDYNVISVNQYLDKTKLGFLSQMVGFLSGYEFAKDSSGNPLIAIDDKYFEMCNGPYAGNNTLKTNTDKLLYNEETGIWEVWTDDDYSIDILNQYILRDMYEQYGTVNTKVITDDWLKYDVYDMGGGNRDIGAYGLMKNYQYLSVFAGSTEVGNNFNVNGEPYIGNETLGMDAAGMPDLAVELATKFGSTTSDRDPVEWLKMFSAMYSMAYFESDIPTLIRTAQAATMAEGSWPYDVVDKCFELYEKYPDNWRSAVIEADTVFRSLNYDSSSYMGCTSINCSFIILGLLYGEGDYYETCKIISLSGHGGDSTTPTALGIVGVICGWSNLDSTSKSIINEKVWQDGVGVIVNLPVDETSSHGTWMHAAGLDERFGIKDLIYMYQANFENLLYENGGFKKDGYYYIPKQTISKVDTVYADSFETTGVSAYTATGGTVTISDVPFMGSNAASVNAASSGDSIAYTTVSGLTVGEIYKLSAFIRTTEGVTAHMFARESGKAIKTYVTAHDPGSYITRYTVGVGANDIRSYIKRELVFTATATSMEIGLMVEDGAPEGGNASFDAVSLVRFEETSVSDVTVSGAKNADGSYNGQIRFDFDGGSDKEVWLKLTYSSNATSLQKAVTLVNRAWQSRTPIAPTGSGKVTVYIPVLVDKEENNLVTMYVGDTDVKLHEVALVTPRDRF